MYLSRAVIRNYKSIKYLDVQFSPGMNVIVGKNNSGKSNIIQAIDICLGNNSPTYDKSENITIDDFYTERDNKEDRLYIYCELSVREGERIDVTQFSDAQYGYYKYNNLIQINLLEDNIDRSIEAIFEISRDTPGIRSTYIKKEDYHTHFNTLDRIAFIFKADLIEDKIVKNMRMLYRNQAVQNWNMAFSVPIRTDFLQSAILPSFRDTSNQLRINDYNWYGKLMKELVKRSGPEQEARLRDAYQNVKSVADEIFAGVQNELNSQEVAVCFPGTEISFQLAADEKTEIHKNSAIYVDDGFRSSIHNKGAGIQSATVIGLFYYYINYINTNVSALLCIEEPELYLHPHACRAINNRLYKFLSDNRNQVIITTHSPEFLRTTDSNMKVIVVKKNNNKTFVRQRSIGDVRGLLIDNNHNEMFFADSIILCEGYDKYIIKWSAEKWAIENERLNLDEKNISVISCDGKENIARIMKLAESLGIDVYIIADFDYILRDNGPNDQAQRTRLTGQGYNFHHSIEGLGIEYFRDRAKRCIGDADQDNGGILFERIRDYRRRLKLEKEEQFYKAKIIDEIDQPFQQELRDILVQLRTIGIHILDGEIEHLFIGQTISKLKLQHVYDLNTRIQDGERLEEIIDTEQFYGFFNSHII